MGQIVLDFTKRTSRNCGSCSLCCRLLPQKELSKLALTRCKHQRHSAAGCCSIYATRPPSCQLWSCQWLMEPDTADLSRPDRSHVVIDSMPDLITIEEPNGTKHDMAVIVAWVDPAYPEAWRHPSLLRFFEARATKAAAEGSSIAVLIRYGSADGYVAFPPQTTGRDDWFVQQSNKEWKQRPMSETLDRLARL